ncbi:BPSL1445 family SYLF domain-containing lipoprotein [Corticibacter populi]|nr:YSC84-related protein [Corticibacter populi]
MLATAIAVGSLTLGACTTTHEGVAHAPASDNTTIDQRADATLSRLYQAVPGSQELVQRAPGVLIFPTVVGGSFVVGAEHGRGVLRVRGRNQGYYSTTGASIGWQAGGQSKAVVYVFNTRDALEKFLASDGFSVGADASVTAGRVGASGNIDTTTANAPVTSFVLTNVGLEAGVSLEGTKITPIKP